MELLAPTASLAALATLGALLALYLYRRRRVRAEVPSLRLWREVQRELAQHAGLKRLQRSASLLLHALALALLALAVGGPARRAPVAPVSRLVLVVDTTASMGAREPGGRTRLDLAREQATAALAALGNGGDVAVIEAGCEPRVALAATRDAREAARALAGLTPRDCGGDLAGAVALAADRARGVAASGGEARVEVFTDAVTRAAELPATAAARATLHTVGAVRANAGITAAELRPAPRGESAGASGRRSLALFVAVQASTGLDTEVRAELLGAQNGSGGRVVAVRALSLAAGRSTATLPVELAEGESADLLRVSLPGDDALAADDVAYAPVPRAGGLAVRLVVASEGASPFAARALGADPDVTLTVMTAAQWAARGGATERFEGLTVFHGTAPAEALEGNALAFGPFSADRALGFALGPERQSPRPTDVSPTDPRVRYVTVDDLHVSSARPPVASPRDVALITSDAGPLAVARDDARGSATLVGFDPHRTDWPLRTGFVLFLRDAVEYARARASALALEARRTGAPVSIPARAASRVRVTYPSGYVRDLPVREGVATLVDTDRAGVYRVDRGAGPERIGLSVLDPVESALAPAALPLRAAAPSAAAPRALERRDLSPWVFALAAALLALEWLVYTGALRRRARPATPPVRAGRNPPAARARA